MPQKLENKEEIILFALPLKAAGETIPKIRAKVEIEFKTPVSQSFMQKNLLKYEGCTTKEEMRERDKELTNPKDIVESETQDKEWSEVVQTLGDQVITDIFDNTAKYIEGANLIMPAPKNGLIVINEITNIQEEITAYLRHKLHPIVPVIKMEAEVALPPFPSEEVFDQYEGSTRQGEENNEDSNQPESGETPDETPEDNEATISEAIKDAIQGENDE